MSQRTAIKDILFQNRLSPKKRYGQNFLVQPNTARQIVEKAHIGLDDTILELGVGFGALTRFIADCAKKVIGLEIDAGIVRWHEEQADLPENVFLRHEDFLAADFIRLAEESGGQLKIVANLPYSVSSPLLFKVIEAREAVAWAVFMLQKEVAQRLTAPLGTKEYGILSVLFGACAEIETLMEIHPAQFHPRPKVFSRVVLITLNPEPPAVLAFPPYNRQIFTALVKAAFQQRRKMVLNSLSSAMVLDLGKEKVEACLNQAKIPPTLRPERMEVKDFINLARAYEEISP